MSWIVGQLNLQHVEHVLDAGSFVDIDSDPGAAANQRLWGPESFSFSESSLAQLLFV
jgi:hypothetical protein